MPIIRKVVSAVQKFVDKLNGMSDAQKETIIKVLALVAAIGPLLLIVGKLISTVGSARYPLYFYRLEPRILFPPHHCK